MSDRFATEVEIGGDIPRSLIPSLAVAIESAGLGLEWGDSSSSEELRKAIMDCNGTATLHVNATELAGGDTETLDEFCVSHGIAFTKRVDGKYEYNGEIHWWHPGLDGVQSWSDTDKEGKLVMLRREALEEALQKGSTLQQVIKHLKAVAPQVPNIRLTDRKRQKPKSRPTRNKGGSY